MLIWTTCEYLEVASLCLAKLWPWAVHTTIGSSTTSFFKSVFKNRLEAFSSRPQRQMTATNKLPCAAGKCVDAMDSLL